MTPSRARQPADLRANASAATAAVLFGASVIAVRVAVREIPPVSLAVLRFGLGGLLLVGILLVAAPSTCGPDGSGCGCSGCWGS